MPSNLQHSSSFDSSFSLNSTRSLPAPVTHRKFTEISKIEKVSGFMEIILGVLVLGTVVLSSPFFLMILCAWYLASPEETKSQFARDDPAFLVLLSACILLSSLGFTIILGLDIISFLKLLLYFLYADCIGSGFVIATILWYIANKYLIKDCYKDQDVEWAYAFDVHLNAFSPMLITSHIVQLLFYNLLIKGNGFFSRLFGNTIWLIAVGYYIYITFLGYKNLKILQSTHVFLMPFLLIFLFYIVSLIIGLNFSQLIMDFYHYRVL